jgi:hypothetical protein
MKRLMVTSEFQIEQNYGRKKRMYTGGTWGYEGGKYTSKKKSPS